MLTAAVALFGAGVASFLAPCVVPLVPAYLGMVVGESADQRNVARVVPATALFVGGFSVVFAALGTAAGWLGSSLDDVQDAFQRVGGVLVALFGLALLGVVRGPLARDRRLVRRLPGAGPVRPVVMGVAFGAAWTPCVGPLLGAALVAAADTGHPLRGGLLLAAYAAGIGVPFLLVSLGLVAAPGAGRWLARVGVHLERGAGVALVILGVLLATGLYRHLASYLARFTPTIGGL